MLHGQIVETVSILIKKSVKIRLLKTWRIDSQLVLLLRIWYFNSNRKTCSQWFDHLTTKTSRLQLNIGWRSAAKDQRIIPIQGEVHSPIGDFVLTKKGHTGKLTQSWPLHFSTWSWILYQYKEHPSSCELRQWKWNHSFFHSSLFITKFSTNLPQPSPRSSAQTLTRSQKELHRNLRISKVIFCIRLTCVPESVAWTLFPTKRENVVFRFNYATSFYLCICLNAPLYK